jgi:aminoglycoside phosphotransferase (APT) family kinase protein
VVRRPRLGHVLATAYDMPREYRVTPALRDARVPVPLTCELDAGAQVAAGLAALGKEH